MEERVPARQVAGTRRPRALARVEEADPGRVGDGERLDGQRLAAPAAGQVAAHATGPRLRPDPAGRERLHVHRRQRRRDHRAIAVGTAAIPAR